MLPRPTIPEFIVDRLASVCTVARVTFADGNRKVLNIHTEKLGPNVLAIYITDSAETQSSNFVVKLELGCTIKWGMETLSYYIPILDLGTEGGIPFEFLTSAPIIITAYHL